MYRAMGLQDTTISFDSNGLFLLLPRSFRARQTGACNFGEGVLREPGPGKAALDFAGLEP
jgi:hypothetical protein